MPQGNENASYTSLIQTIKRFTYTKVPNEQLKRFAVLTHMPEVDCSNIDLFKNPFGYIGNYDFESWIDFEGLEAFDWKGYYGDNQSFFGIAVDTAENSDSFNPIELQQFSRKAADILWLLLTTTYSTFTTHPDLSLSYVLLRRYDGFLRSGRYRGFGELELLRMPKSIIIKSEDISILTTNANIFERIFLNSGYGEYARQLTSVFKLIATKEHLPSSWISFIAHLEFFLNPFAAYPLKIEFSERFATVTARNATEYSKYREIGSLLYSFRSDFIHGQKFRMNKKLVEFLGSDNYPFPSDILRRIMEFLYFLSATPKHETQTFHSIFQEKEMLIETFYSSEFPRINTIKERTNFNTETENNQTTAKPFQMSKDIVDYEVSYPSHLINPSVLEKLAGAETRTTDEEQPNNESKMFGEQKNQEENDNSFKVTYKGSTSISTSLYKKVINPDLYENPIDAGIHFADFGGEDILVFIPIIGLDIVPAFYWLNESESIYTMDNILWNSLESARYRDVYGTNILSGGINYFIKRYKKENNLFSDLTTTSSEPYQALQTRVSAFSLALLLSDPGSLITIDKVPWTVTNNFYRNRLRTGRFRFYSWRMNPEMQLFKTIKVDEEEEFVETPIMYFRESNITGDDELIEEAKKIQETICSLQLYQIPELKEIFHLYQRFRDPSESLHNRLLNIITVFELCFGLLSKQHIGNTYKNVEILFKKIKGYEFPSEEQFIRGFSALRNAIAHGREPDEQWKSIEPMDTIMRVFLLMVINNEELTQGNTLDKVPLTFKKIKAIMFGNQV